MNDSSTDPTVIQLSSDDIKYYVIAHKYLDTADC